MKTQKLIWPFLVMSSMASVSSSLGHEWMAPKDSAAVQNPVVFEQESIIRGQVLFLKFCSSCHGENARGMKAEDAGLKKSSPDLVKRLSTHTDGDFFWKIQEGKEEMPSFKKNLSNPEIWDIINFIKSNDKE